MHDGYHWAFLSGNNISSCNNRNIINPMIVYALGIYALVSLGNDALIIFYSVINASLLVPIVGGLYIRRGGSAAALASIAAGLATLFVVRFGVMPLYRWVDPLLTAIIAAAVAYFSVVLMRRRPLEIGSVHPR